MHRIKLDARCWRTEADLWADLLSALKAPDWHGANLDALNDTIREAASPPHPEWGFSNDLQPPYTIRVANARLLEAALRARLDRIQDVFADARAKCGLDVDFVIDN